jgi:hypothetical protein
MLSVDEGMKLTAGLSTSPVSLGRHGSGRDDERNYSWVLYDFGCMPEGSAPGFAGGLKVTGILCPRWQVPQVTVF